jgi:hypothetical protein
VLLTTRDRDVAAALHAQAFELAPLDTETGFRLMEAILGERALEETEAGAAISDAAGRAAAGAGNPGPAHAQPPAAHAAAGAHPPAADPLAAGPARGRRPGGAHLVRAELADAAAAAAALFAALALFGGRPFHPRAVEAVAAEPEAAWRLADLAALSLVQQAGDDYYRQHALLADYAREKLGALALDEAALEQRLLAYYGDFVAGHHRDYRRWPRSGATSRRRWKPPTAAATGSASTTSAGR